MVDTRGWDEKKQNVASQNQHHSVNDGLVFCFLDHLMQGFLVDQDG